METKIKELAENGESRNRLMERNWTESPLYVGHCPVKEVIKMKFAGQKRITRLDYEKNFNASERTANRELSGLVNLGILKKGRETPCKRAKNTPKEAAG